MCQVLHALHASCASAPSIVTLANSTRAELSRHRARIVQRLCNDAPLDDVASPRTPAESPPARGCKKGCSSKGSHATAWSPAAFSPPLEAGESGALAIDSLRCATSPSVSPCGLRSHELFILPHVACSHVPLASIPGCLSVHDQLLELFEVQCSSVVTYLLEQCDDVREELDYLSREETRLQGVCSPLCLSQGIG